MSKSDPSGVVSTQNAAASAFKVSAKTMSAWKAESGESAGFRPDGSVDLTAMAAWRKARKKKRQGKKSGIEAERDEKIRKLRLANDKVEARLVERAWVAEKIQLTAGELNAFRSKSEAEWPTKFAAAAGDVVACRMLVRQFWDETFAALGRLSKNFNENTNSTPPRGIDRPKENA